MNPDLYDYAIYDLLTGSIVSYRAYSNMLAGMDNPAEAFGVNAKLAEVLLAQKGVLNMMQVTARLSESDKATLARINRDVLDSSPSYVENARLILQTYQDRTHRNALNEALDMPYSERAGFLRGVEAYLGSLGRENESHAMSVIAKEAKQQVLDILAGKTTLIIPSGFHKLDAQAFLSPGEFALIVGPAKVGKTAMAIQVAYNVANDCLGLGQGCVVVFSMEMTGEKLARRLAATEAQFDLGQLQDVSEGLKQRPDKFLQAFDNLGELPLYIHPTAGLNASQMLDYVKMRADQHNGVRLVVLDYATKASADNKYIRDAYERLKAIMDDFAGLIKTHKNPDGTRAAAIVVGEMRKNLSDNKLPDMDDINYAGQYQAGIALVPVDPKMYLTEEYDFELGMGLPQFSIPALTELYDNRKFTEYEVLWQIILNRNAPYPRLVTGLEFVPHYTLWREMRVSNA